MADIEELRRRFRDSGNDQQNRSPFCTSLNRHIAEAPDIASILGSAPEQQQLPVLLLAAVHSLVLAEPELELGRWYPTVADDPLDSDPYPSFARLCRDREAELRAIVATRVTQTNEVGRCALLLPALKLVHDEVGPLSIVDIGTSAGLNLHLDRFGYRYEPGGEVGLPSPVVIETGTRGAVPVPAQMPEIAARIGLDQSPIDINDEVAMRWLLACVWPDQPDRFRRLRAAIEVARRNPAPVVAGDAVGDLAGLVAGAASTGHPVVLNSWVLNYLDGAARTAYVEALDTFGRDRDLSWIFAEAPAMCPELPFPEHVRLEQLTTLMLATWRAGRRTVDHLAVAHPHGYWLHWV